MYRRWKTIVKSLARQAAYALGYQIHAVPKLARGPGHESVRPLATWAPWANDAAFIGAYRRIRGHTLVDVYRAYELWTLVAQSAKLTPQGALIEVGVWRGGTTALIATQARRCGLADTLYACDTFRGVVKAGPADTRYRGGEHADTSRQVVERLLTGMDIGPVEILEGVFPDQTGAAVKAERVRFCHIDVDSYDSAEDILKWVWPRLVLGGLIVYDDYGFAACPGITRHVDQQRPLSNRVVFHNLNGHAVVVKIAH